MTVKNCRHNSNVKQICTISIKVIQRKTLVVEQTFTFECFSCWFLFFHSLLGFKQIRITLKRNACVFFLHRMQIEDTIGIVPVLRSGKSGSYFAIVGGGC